MYCPRCQNQNSRVVDSRSTNDHKSTRRRRQCEACGYRFTTFETIATANFIIIKKDGSREPYDRDKLLSSIWKSCEKRQITQDQLEKLLDALEQEWSTMGKEVSSSAIGEGIMRKLKDLDEVAYIRFAAVYRQFKDVKTFKEEIGKLLG